MLGSNAVIQENEEVNLFCDDHVQVTKYTIQTTIEGKNVEPNVVFDLECIPIQAYVLPFPIICCHCGAKKFAKETNSFCCSNGEIKLKINNVPKELYELYTSKSNESLEFKTFIRIYNSNFSFTSFGVKNDKDLCKRNKGIYTFRVQGQVYHYINDMLPLDSRPSYLQLYFYDTDHELQNRLNMSSKLSPQIVCKIMDILRINPYSMFFRTLSDVVGLKSHTIQIRSNSGHDQRFYNAPYVSQVAAIWVDDDPSANNKSRNITVYCHSGDAHRVQYYFGCYDPLQYPLLFPHGNNGWHEGIERVNKHKVQNSSKKEDLIDVHKFNSAIELMQKETIGIKE